MSAIDNGPDMFFSDTSPTTMWAIIYTVNVILPGLLDATRQRLEHAVALLGDELRSRWRQFGRTSCRSP